MITERVRESATLARVAVCLFCAAWGANAQVDDGLFPGGLSVGIRAGAVFKNPMQSQSIREARSTEDPPYVNTDYSYSDSWRAFLGPTVEYRISDRFGVVADFLYRRVGYEEGYNYTTQEGWDEGEWIASGSQTVRAEYWDVPIQLRYYFRELGLSYHRFYMSGGVAFRTVKGVESYTETTVDPDQELVDSNSIPIEPARDRITGAVAGFGLELVDEVGTKIDIEVRFTRWFNQTFESGPTQSNQNQGEVIVGVSF